MKDAYVVAVLLRPVYRHFQTNVCHRRHYLLWFLPIAIALLLAAPTLRSQQPSVPAQAPDAQSIAPAGDLNTGPVNPEFVEYLNNQRSRNPRPMTTLHGHSLGYVPSPLDLSHLNSQPSPLIQNGALPSSYDLRSHNKVSPVRDQGQCGSCWAFATYGSAESILMPAQSRDFSENHLKNRAGFDWTPCQGGNALMSAAYLARWSGPVHESDDPYQASDTDTSPATATVQKHVQQMIIIPGRASSTDNNQIKTAVITRGGVAVSMYMDESSTYLNPATSAYYFNDSSAQSTNHMVTVVGWDDNYSKANFAQTPAGNGAFLIKNSWGTGWGLNGYFWVSYYTLLFSPGWSAAFGGAVPTSMFSQKYEYDPLGWTSYVGYTGSDTLHFANMFTATQSGYLDAVATYLATNNSTYSLQIYKGTTAGNPISGTLVFTDSGTVPFAGYNTFTVNPTHLIKGDTFSVVMLLTTPGFDWPGPFETVVDGYSSKATAAAGQGFFSPDGQSWFDFTTFDGNANFALKAFASADATPPTATPTFTPPQGTYTTPQTVTIVAAAGTTVHYTTDGSTPTIFSPLYTAPIGVSKSTTIKAIGIAAAHSTSAIAKAVYTVNMPVAAAPTIKPAAGTFGMSQWVTLTAVTPNTTPYYTVDGSTPTVSSTKYTGRIAVNTSQTIKAIAAGTQYAPSPVVTAAYKLVPSSEILTGLATPVGTTTATVNATLNDFGGTGQVWFMWGATAGTLTNSTAKVSLAASSNLQKVSANLTGLTSKKQYYFRPAVTTAGGTSYGAVQSLTTN